MQLGCCGFISGRRSWRGWQWSQNAAMPCKVLEDLTLTREWGNRTFDYERQLYLDMWKPSNHPSSHVLDSALFSYHVPYCNRAHLLFLSTSNVKLYYPASPFPIFLVAMLINNEAETRTTTLIIFFRRIYYATPINSALSSASTHVRWPDIQYQPPSIKTSSPRSFSDYTRLFSSLPPILTLLGREIDTEIAEARLAAPSCLNLRMDTQTGSFANAYEQNGEEQVKWLRCVSGVCERSCCCREWCWAAEAFAECAGFILRNEFGSILVSQQAKCLMRSFFN